MGLFINRPKTKALVIGNVGSGTISLSSGNIDTVPDFCYLGSWVRTSAKDLQTRKAKAFTAANKLWKIWKAPHLSRDLKLKLFRATVESVLLYGAQCWSFTTAQTRSLDGTYTRLLRKYLNISYTAHVTNAALYGKLPSISSTLRTRRLRFAGHCYRRLDQPVRSALFFEPPGKFKLGGQARMNFVRQLCRDTNLTKAELPSSITDLQNWKTVCVHAGVGSRSFER